MTKPTKIFLASSNELKADRDQFEIAIARKNERWIDKGVVLQPVRWENFLDAVSQTRLQDEYNRAIRDCDIFVMLFHTKVGPYTEEEFETAHAQFKATGKPQLYTYLNTAPGGPEQPSLTAFKSKLRAIGHFFTPYDNTDALLRHFNDQLDILAANGYIEFQPESEANGDATSQATLTGNGAINQGSGTAIGAGGVYVGGANSGTINTGTLIQR